MPSLGETDPCGRFLKAGDQVRPPKVGYLSCQVGHRYERGSVIVTTNKPFDRWGQVFSGDDIVPQLYGQAPSPQPCDSYTKGPSYRMKDKLAHPVHLEGEGGILGVCPSNA